jgi:hypothetical protein
MSHQTIANLVLGMIRDEMNGGKQLGNSVEVGINLKKALESKKRKIRGKASREYDRLCANASFLAGFRVQCHREQYNRYQTGRYLSNLMAANTETRANAPELNALAIYRILSTWPDLPVYRIMIWNHNMSLHESCIVGEMPSPVIKKLRLHQIGTILPAPQSIDPPWVIDPMFNVSASLGLYYAKLSAAMLGRTHDGQLFERISPVTHPFNKHAETVQYEKKFAREIPLQPIDFFHMLQDGKVAIMRVTKDSQDIALSDPLVSDTSFLYRNRHMF